MKHHALFFKKLRKMSQNLSSAAVVIGALRVNKKYLCFSPSADIVSKYNLRVVVLKRI